MKPKLKPNHDWSFEAIGTHWWIGLYQPCSREQLIALQQAISARIEEYDVTYSRFRDDSLVTKVAIAAGRYQLPPDSVELLALYRDLYDATEGSVTPLVGQLLSDAGYDAAYSLQPKTLRPVPAWDDVLSAEGSIITTTQPVVLDFGAAGKGYLVDILGKLLQGFDITQFCIDGSGDMYCQGLGEPLRVGLENPHNAEQAIGVASIKNGALCGSSGARRAWKGFTHIISPFTQQSPEHIAALWVSAPTALVADGMATALFFAEPAVLQQVRPFEYAIMYSDNSVSHSKGFPAEFFTD